MGVRAAVAWMVALAAAAAAGEAVGPEPAHPLREGPVLVARVDGTINPASADYVITAIAEAEREGAALLLIELDTPGGMVSSTQEIVKAMLGADVPIAVYVSPKGAWAASAGTFITMAAHVAAMAPRASIGAAHPVSAFGPSQAPPPAPPSSPDEEGESPPPPTPPTPAPADYDAQKAENTLASFIESIAAERGRNVEWAERAVRESVAATAEQALELGVVDLVASTRQDLLEQADGRTVQLAGGSVRLSVKDAPQRELPMGAIARFLHTIWNPTIALMLLSAGGILLWMEFSSPGIGVPGVLGVTCILVAAVSLQVLPFSWLGLLLFVGGLGLLGIEVLVPSHGLLLTAGLIAMLLGGSMIFDRPEASDLNVPFWRVVAPVVGSFAGFGAIVASAVARVLRAPSKMGEGELLGMRGVASTALAPSGTVSLRGELWSAEAEGEIAQGDPVEVVAVEGMRLRVRRAPKRA
jgi:membrane-bound serine protease (ClpP class)